MSSCIQGKCLCNQYSFEVLPQYIKFGFASCHCSLCRGSHASPFVLWSGMKAEHSQFFKVIQHSGDLSREPKENLSSYRTSSNCVRYFCGNCGTHLFIEYDCFPEDAHPDRKKSPWEGEIHFPTALLDENSVRLLEEAVQGMNKPRYLHVFYSDRTSAMGDLEEWAKAPKYGGPTGIEPLP